MKVNIRPAKAKDSQAIFELIKILAEYEKAPEQVENTVQEILRDGFEATPAAFECFVAENVKGEVLGMALYYYRYSTWKGRTLHLEDLIIKPEYRTMGIGDKLFNQVMAVAKAQRLRRVEWEVLEWNISAIDFYKSKGAVVDPEWHLCKLYADGLEKF